MRRLLLVAIVAPLPFLWCGAVSLQSADPAPFRRTAAASADTDSTSVPMIVVKAPKQTVAGKLVKLDASQSNVDSLEWHLVDGPLEDFDVADQGRRATFSNPKPGVYFLAIAGAKLVDGKAVAVGAVVKVELIPDPDKPDPPVTPPATPPTTPPVTPPIVPPTNSLAVWVQATASATVTADPTRARTATGLAAAYRQWARGLGGQQSDLQTFVIGHNKVLDLLLGQIKKQDAWKPFRDALDAKLATMGMTTVPQHVAAWEEIAQGLELVK